jgi:hypothetical protein
MDWKNEEIVVKRLSKRSDYKNRKIEEYEKDI